MRLHLRALTSALAVGLAACTDSPVQPTGSRLTPRAFVAPSQALPETEIVSLDADTYLKQGTPNQNQGTEVMVRLQQSGKNRALLRVSPSAIATAVGNRIVEAAWLDLTISDNGNNWGTTGRTINLHTLTSDWTELGATWKCALDSDTQNSAPDCSGTTSWEMDNAGPNPWNPGPSATALITNGLSGIVSLDVTSDLTAWLAGTAQNRGWILKKSDEGDAGRIEFSSREGSSPPVLRLVVREPVIANAFCGQTLDLTGGQMPSGWTQLIVRGGPGLVNDRLEGQQTDGGARIGVAASPVAISKITIDYDALSNQSFWGTQHGINLGAGSTILTIYEVNAEFNFGAGNLGFRVTSGDVLWPFGSTVLVDEDIQGFDPGQHHYKLEITASHARWTITNVQTNRVVQTALSMPFGFNMSAIDSLYFHVYETTGGGTWADNISIVCQ